MHERSARGDEQESRQEDARGRDQRFGAACEDVSDEMRRDPKNSSTRRKKLFRRVEGYAN